MDTKTKVAVAQRATENVASSAPMAGSVERRTPTREQINVRLDSDLKRAATLAAEDMGLDLSSLVRMFLIDLTRGRVEHKFVTTED